MASYGVDASGGLWGLTEDRQSYSLVEESPRMKVYNNVTNLYDSDLLLTTDGDVYDATKRETLDLGGRSYIQMSESNYKHRRCLLLSDEHELFDIEDITKPIVTGIKAIVFNIILFNRFDGYQYRCFIQRTDDNRWYQLTVIIDYHNNSTSHTISDLLGAPPTGDFISHRCEILQTTDGYWYTDEEGIKLDNVFIHILYVIPLSVLDNIIASPSCASMTGITAITTDYEYINGFIVQGEYEPSLSANIELRNDIKRLGLIEKWVHMYQIGGTVYLSNELGQMFSMNYYGMKLDERYPEMMFRPLAKPVKSHHSNSSSHHSQKHD